MINLALTSYLSAVLPISYLFKGIFPESPYQVYLHILAAIAAFGKYFFFSSERWAPLTSLNKILESIKASWACSSLVRAQEVHKLSVTPCTPLPPPARRDASFLRSYPFPCGSRTRLVLHYPSQQLCEECFELQGKGESPPSGCPPPAPLCSWEKEIAHHHHPVPVRALFLLSRAGEETACSFRQLCTFRTYMNMFEN